MENLYPMGHTSPQYVCSLTASDRSQVRSLLPIVFYMHIWYFFSPRTFGELALFYNSAYYGCEVLKVLSGDFPMNSIVLIWLVMALVFLMLEMGHPGLFFFLSFFVGAINTALLSIWVDSWILQGLVFLGSSALSFLLLHFLVARLIKQAHSQKHTNVYALQGKRGIVVHAIKPTSSGQVKLGGEIWSARALDDGAIGVGAPVSVVMVKGVHLIVEKVSE
jgi:membrane protein implicated in regulation of membrane protease activity